MADLKPFSDPEGTAGGFEAFDCAFGMNLRVFWHWAAMGPYHFARMNAVGRQPGIDLTVAESTCLDDHAWKRSETPSHFQLQTLSCEMLSSRLYRSVASRYAKLLDAVSPDVIIASGYFDPFSRSANMAYRKAHPKTSVLFWSETTSRDHRRRPFREFVKRLIVSQFDGAVVAGRAHGDYLAQLGLPQHAIQIVGNVVDNDYFATTAQTARNGGRPTELPDRYFLYVGRFIPPKDLPTLIEAFASYWRSGPALPHHLVLAGSGPLEHELRRLAASHGIDSVHFVGNKQVHELPALYAFASALVLPSRSEPWGLVVNEAMACGIPVIASENCGSAEALVRNGETGWIVAKQSPEALTECFGKLSKDPELPARMGSAARDVVTEFSPDKYAGRVVEHLFRLARLQKVRRPYYRESSRMLIDAAEMLLS